MSYNSTHAEYLSVCGEERDSPAMLILAGVAFRDAGVLVLLLLLGVTPLMEKKTLDRNQLHALFVVQCTLGGVLPYLAQALGNGP